ncbi:hypothetical protein JOC86_002403 [Bacillus pakistanensis]|uniref:DUF4325 domain-containing protein n=1 Tax=Rossellomorea pakistanensis TaxID=992288 RepID=A0ABS2NDD7_9BACI|nr:STAS-like domain-containing protein [Bacillus pakistanensis]MBM7585861.1 hypothetical protein [Bacillus pakistanensis]
MGLIRISDHIGRCYSNKEGKTIQTILKRELNKGNPITVSFEKIDGVTSSFVNTAFIELLDDFEFNTIKSSIKFINTSKQINEMIKDRFKFEVDRRKKLVLA